MPFLTMRGGPGRAAAAAVGRTAVPPRTNTAVAHAVATVSSTSTKTSTGTGTTRQPAAVHTTGVPYTGRTTIRGQAIRLRPTKRGTRP
mmetsp:Transcript_3024/g.11427  ORF Transcript_3024/g.11427 Transcript_3024/m.11427 type:complete len:88 (+) Transcript_3024:173-436(+)